MLENKIEKLIKILKESKNTVFFGGAGVSTESGLKDFRSKDGLYNEKYDYPPEEILSHHFFIEHPAEFYKFYKDKLNSLTYHPNKAHYVLANLENKKLLKGIITQNIDGFHQEAGSKNVVEIHGSVHRNYCLKCHKYYDAKKVFLSKGIPRCDCGGLIKPDVVLYEEPLNEMVLTKAIIALQEADLLIIAGTSLSVYPANGLINYFFGDNIVVINNNELNISNKKVKLFIKDKVGKVFSKLN